MGKPRLLLIALALAAGHIGNTGLAVASPVLVETVKGSQHPNHHINGFVLRSTYIHVDSGRRLLRRALQFDENPHLLDLATAHSQTEQRRLFSLPEFSAELNSRDRVIALSKVHAILSLCQTKLQSESLTRPALIVTYMVASDDDMPLTCFHTRSLWL